jgi:hypothetical protein
VAPRYGHYPERTCDVKSCSSLLQPKSGQQRVFFRDRLKDVIAWDMVYSTPIHFSFVSSSFQETDPQTD